MVSSKGKACREKKAKNSAVGKVGEKKEGNNNQKRPNKVQIEEFTEAKCYIHSTDSPYILPYTLTHTHTHTVTHTLTHTLIYAV